MSREFIIRKNESNAWNNTSILWDYLKSLPEGKYKITVQKADKRTLPQNAWIHAVLPLIRDGLREQGYNEIRTLDDAKDFIKTMFFKKAVTNGIETVEIVQGTSETSKLDFASRAEDIIQWAHEYLGIDIAPPNHQFEFFE